MKYQSLLKPLAGCLLLAAALPAASQTNPCAFDPIHNQLLQQNDVYRKAVGQNENRIRQYLETPQLRTTGTVYTIPVVVHIIHNGEAVGVGANISDAQVQSAITAMSQHYRAAIGNSTDAEIQFKLATIDPNCNATNGIERINGSAVSGYAANGLITGTSGNEIAVKNLSRWPTGNYYNIWIVSEINNNNGGAGIQGFAYFPGAPSNLDGAIILYNAFGYDPSGSIGYSLKTYTRRNTTATHEMGHALGLYHTFQGDDSNPNDANDAADQCPPNASCSTQGDLVCDTDPHQRTPSTCPSTSTINPCTGNPIGNVIKNYMDYSSETCQDRFTPGQIARMRAALELIRPGLTTSLAASASYPYGTYMAPVAASCTPTTSGDGLSGAYAGIMNVNLANRNFTSSDASASGDNGYINGTASCLNAVQLQSGASYTITITTLSTNYEQVRVWIDYNNNGVFENATESIYANSNITPAAGGYVKASGNFTVPGSAVAGSFLRLRLVNDLGTAHGKAPITSACYDPQYGQAEDYAVKISNVVLPVTLVDFSGKLQNDKVLLSWTTSDERNAKNFDVQRADPNGDFGTIGTIAASNTAGAHDYSFTDTRPLTVNRYRLKMNDLDGRSQYSSIVVLRNEAALQSLSVSGNPFRQSIQLRFAKNPVGLRLQLIDRSGTIVSEKVYGSAGQTIVWHLPASLSKGLYILKAITAEGVFTQKMVKE